MVVWSRITPASWLEVKEIIQNEDYHLLGRTPEAEEYYKVNLAKELSKYSSKGEYIADKVFGKRLEELTDDNEIILLRHNSYPYALEEGCSHYVLWSTKKLDSDEIKRRLPEYEELKNRDYIFWVNPANLQSMPMVHHAHVICGPHT